MNKINKRGYVRVLEAGIAILLLLGFIYFVTLPTYVNKSNIDEDIYRKLNAILDEIENTNSYRDMVFIDGGLQDLQDFVREELSENQLDGTLVICDIGVTCFPSQDVILPIKDIYVKERIIVKSSADVKKTAIYAWTKY
ncbi:MAG: hypothetical protein KJ767_00625 [Nanoarchaeota archaeon]|nr:hypothetical protein [Nanoarchaeota archaeon]